MWKKMNRQGGGVDSVYDAVALRVVLKAKRQAGETEEAYEEKSKQLCYHVRGLSCLFLRRLSRFLHFLWVGVVSVVLFSVQAFGCLPSLGEPPSVFRPLRSRCINSYTYVRAFVFLDGIFFSGHVGGEEDVPGRGRSLQGLRAKPQAERLPEPPQHARGGRVSCRRRRQRRRTPHAFRTPSPNGVDAPQGGVRARGPLELQERRQGRRQRQAAREEDLEGVQAQGHGDTAAGEGRLHGAGERVVREGAHHLAAP